jgi:ribosomal protein S12 methylthiotransferase accessory factor
MIQNDTLQPILELYRSHLPEGELQNFRIDPNDHLGIPVVDATFVPAHRPQRYNGVGYGAEETKAQLSAFGELYEFMKIPDALFERTYREASYTEMLRKKGAGQVIDPLTLVLPAGSHYHPELKLKWTEVKKLSDDAPAWVPIEFVANTSAEIAYDHQLITSITNGNGTGDSRERALLHALLELLQRDGNCDSFRALDQGKVISKSGIAAETRALIDELGSKGLEIIPKLARKTCGCVSVYAVGRDHSDDPFPLSLTACGEAADLDFDRAMHKAVLECASSHSRKLFYHSSFERKGKIAPEGYVERNRKLVKLEKEEKRALHAMVEWLSLTKEQLYGRLKNTVFFRKEMIHPQDLPAYAETDIPAKLDAVRRGIEAEGMDIYYFEATPPDAPVQVVKAIVPGMEMEFGSYHRIGARGVRRLLGRNDPLISRQAGAGKEKVMLTRAREEALGGPHWLDTQRLDRLIDPLYPLYREPSGHSAAYAYETGYFDQ